jgi:hypothetical protein
MPILVLLIGSLLIHLAPSGWEYPPHCCTKGDCHPVPCQEISRTDNGLYWKWHGFHFSEPQHHLSGDSECHVCIAAPYPLMGRTVPHCIFTPHSPIS